MNSSRSIGNYNIVITGLILFCKFFFFRIVTDELSS